MKVLRNVGVELLHPIMIAIRRRRSDRTRGGRSGSGRRPRRVLRVISRMNSIMLLMPFLGPSAFFVGRLVSLASVLLRLDNRPFVLFIRRILGLLPIGVVSSS